MFSPLLLSGTSAVFVRCCHNCIFGLEQDGDSMASSSWWDHFACHIISLHITNLLPTHFTTFYYKKYIPTTHLNSKTCLACYIHMSHPKLIVILSNKSKEGNIIMASFLCCWMMIMAAGDGRLLATTKKKQPEKSNEQTYYFSFLLILFFNFVSIYISSST